MSTVEAEFDEEQVDLLLALQAVKADTGPHGQPLTEATDPMGRPGIKDGPGGWHYEAHVIATDYAAEALRTAQDGRYKDEKAAASRDSDMWVVEKRPDRIHRPAKRER